MIIERNSADIQPFTASDLMMETLSKSGVDYIFANLGSDHPAIVETWAKFAERGVVLPKIIICPHEMVALSAAHGYTQATGKLQAVFVHVDVGTQNLGGALHNAMRGRIPVFIFAGASPVTLDGELKGSRNEYIHYLQDVFDQRGIVREYTKWSHDLHAGQNVDLIVKRALQIANSEPRGPVYLMAAREMLEQPVTQPAAVERVLQPVMPSALAPSHVEEIAEALANAAFPLIITSYLGRNEEAVEHLVRLSDRLAIPVIESGPYYMNFPASHPMHLGYEDFVHPNPYLGQADVIVVLDCDIPWMTQQSNRAAGSRLYWIDTDPIKEAIPLWYYSGEVPFRADVGVFLQQVNTALACVEVDGAKVEHRRQVVSTESTRLRDEWRQLEAPRTDGTITPEYLTAVLRELTDEQTIFVNETISNYSVVWRHLPRDHTGTLYASGASSLGWHGGAAIGVKLARPDSTVIALTGDGSYVFGVPTAVHWVARRYDTPFLTVIYHNGGWKSPKLSTLAVHPEGAAARNADFHVGFSPYADLERVAEAAGGAYAVKVTESSQLRSELQSAISMVKQGRSAVVSVMLDSL